MQAALGRRAPPRDLRRHAGGGYSRDAGHGDCARTPRKVRACGAPDGWRAMPARRRVGALYGKLGIDPTDLSLLGEQDDVPT